METGYSKLFEAINLLKPSFEGRITLEEYVRAGFWLAIVILVFYFITAGGMVAFIIAEQVTPAIVVGCVCGIALIALFVSSCSLMARRLHDAGYSGHYLWLILLCFVGFIIPVILCLCDTVEDNEWGPGNNNHSGSKFSDLKRSVKYILHPASRIALKDYWLAITVLNMIGNFASQIVGYIAQILFMPLYMTQSSSSDLNTSAGAISMAIVGFVIMLIPTVLLLIFYIRLGIARLHDTGRSGSKFLWLLLFPLGIIIPYIMCLADSDEDNEYGIRTDGDDGNSLGSDDSNSFYDSNHSSKDECFE